MRKFIVWHSGNGYHYLKKMPMPERYLSGVGQQASYHIYDMTRKDLWHLFWAVLKGLL